MSGVGKRLTLTGLMRIKGGVVPLLGNESVISNREWKVHTELDAQASSRFLVELIRIALFEGPSPLRSDFSDDESAHEVRAGGKPG